MVAFAYAQRTLGLLASTSSNIHEIDIYGSPHEEIDYVVHYSTKDTGDTKIQTRNQEAT